jgi:hypothetical protein
MPNIDAHSRPGHAANLPDLGHLCGQRRSRGSSPLGSTTRLSEQARLTRMIIGDTGIPTEWLHLTMQGIGFVDEPSRDQANTAVKTFNPRFGPSVTVP